MNKALKLKFVNESRSKYFNKGESNVNRLVCGVFSRPWAVLSVFVLCYVWPFLVLTVFGQT